MLQWTGEDNGTHSSTLAWKIPWTEKPGGLQSRGSQESEMTYRLSHHHTLFAAAAAKSLQSCPTLYDPIDGSPPGSPVPGILQARTLEWVAISFSNAWKWKVKVKTLSHVWLLATPWTAAHQAPPSMGFSRQEYWSGVPLPSLDDSNTTKFGNLSPMASSLHLPENLPSLPTLVSFIIKILY